MSDRIVEPLVAALKYPVGWLARVVFDLEVSGRERLPDGGYVISGNHLSFIDPVIITLAADRNIGYLATGGIFEPSVMFSQLIRFFGARPLATDRVPVGAIRGALHDLELGKPVAVFPEGRRVPYWREAQPHRGAAWIALAAGVPLVPVAMYGNHGTMGLVQSAFRRSAIRVWIEEPIDVLDYAEHEDPLSAVNQRWADVIGARLDPWWEDDPIAGPAVRNADGSMRDN